MRALSLVVLVGFVSAAVAACGGKSNKQPKAGDNESDMPEGGASPIGEGGAGVGQAGRGGADGVGAMGVGPSPDAGGGLGTAASWTGGVGGGGSSTGGAPSGGAPGTLTSGGPNRPDLIEPPPNCTSVSQSADGKQCNYEFSCDAKSQFTSCRLNSDGTWACECATFSSQSRAFEIDGVEGIEACGVTARACVGDVAASETRICKRKEQSSDDYSCSARDTCGPDLYLDPGVRVRAVEQYSSRCELQNQLLGEVMLCSCDGGALGHRSYTVKGPSIDQACGFMIGSCTGEERPTVSEPETCDEEPPTSDGNICSLTQRCEESVEIGMGVSLTRAWDRAVQCEPLNGVSLCYCFDDEMRFEFDVNMDPGDPETCTAGLEACPLKTKLEPNGTISCMRTPDQGWGAESCDMELSCRQPVRSNGIQITGYGVLDVTCEKAPSGGPWWCSCASSATSKTFELGIAQDGRDACDAAAARCQSELDVVVGLHENADPVAPRPLP